MRRRSSVTILLISIGLALVGNLAANTVSVDASWWPWAVWIVTGTLAVTAIVAEGRRATAAAHSGASSGDVGAVIEQLAASVHAQWVREERQRRVHDPVPLPLRWRVASDRITDHWVNIHGLDSGESGSSLPLSGTLSDIAAVYRRVPSGRLVILGPAGAGKTVVLSRLVLDLLSDRRPGQPVPVIVGLGSWNPAERPLTSWLAGQLVRDHPGLDVLGPHGSMAETLIDAGLIVPILDGFDEIAEGLHGDALRQLNAVPDMPLVATSRSAEFAAAVAGTDVLTAAAVVELEPVRLQDLTHYLPRTTRRTTTMSDGRPIGIWSEVIHQLTERSTPATRAVTLALSTPLMVYLARTIYSDTPSQDPRELLDSARFSTRAEVQEHLIATYIPATYRQPSPADGRAWDPELARHWLTFLANHLNRMGARDLAWWQLRDAVPRAVRVLTVVILIGTAYGLAALLPVVQPVDTQLTSFFELTFGMVLALTVWLRRGDPLRRLRRPAFNLRRAAVIVAIAGPVALLSLLIIMWTVLMLVDTTSMPFAVGLPCVALLTLATFIEVRLRARRSRRSLRPRSQYEQAPARGVTVGISGALATLLLGISGMWYASTIETHPQVLLVVMTMVGLAVGLPEGLSRATPPPARTALRLHGRIGILAVRVMAGVAVGLGAMLPIALSLFVMRPWSTASLGLTTWLGFGLAFGVVVGLLVAFVDLQAPLDLSAVASSHASLAKDRRNSIVQIAVLAAASGGAVGLALGFSAGIIVAETGFAIRTGVLAGLAVAVAVAITVGLTTNAWGQWLITARFWLPLTGQLPWPVLAFLADAHRRGVLRQAGAVYQFRHAILQDHLAANAQRQHPTAELL